jgi:peroxiredoxin
MKPITAIRLALIVASGFLVGCKKEPAQQTGVPVPASYDFTLKDHAGKDVRLADMAGKIVVLEWLNPECPFVQAHYKSGTMSGLAKKYAGKGVIWIGINSTNSATIAANKSFVDSHSLPYPVLDDHAGVVGKKFGAKTTPHLFILDSKTRIVYQGAIDNAPMGEVPDGQTAVNYVDQALAELTSGKAVSIAKTDSYGCSVKY